MKKSELREIIREELGVVTTTKSLGEESNRFGELEKSTKGNYKFYTNPKENFEYQLKLLNKTAKVLMNAIKTGDGKAIDDAIDNIKHTYAYYFMVK